MDASPRQLLERAVHDRAEIRRLFRAHGADHNRPQPEAPLHFDDLILALRKHPDALATHLAAAMEPRYHDLYGVRRTSAGFEFGWYDHGRLLSERETPDAAVAVSYWILSQFPHVLNAALPPEPPQPLAAPIRPPPPPGPPPLASLIPCPLCRVYGLLIFVKPAGLPVALECDECGQLFADRDAALAHRPLTLPPGTPLPNATLSEVAASPLAGLAADATPPPG